ncbi:hypothetical protein SEA_TWONLO_58 [Gordonia phage Twonlo]|nr:hypothetical protein SEA_TWONLO_58 [Gordonia phage Twonlo]QWY80253.1 hypothetical protein SEA_EDMUNDFERRY_57 [Gordonia phage EdmundFerry]
MTDERTHPAGIPWCRQCGHANLLHGDDGCLVRSCSCWRTADSLSTYIVNEETPADADTSPGPGRL